MKSTDAVVNTVSDRGYNSSTDDSLNVEKLNSIESSLVMSSSPSSSSATEEKPKHHHSALISTSVSPSGLDYKIISTSAGVS